MKTALFVTSLLLLSAGIVAGYPAIQREAPAPIPVTRQPVDPVQAARPRIEVVFVLDTTGSMGGLIQAAKENIWSIASSMASAQPTPELAVGLVAFRDRGDAYVTRVVDLSTDLDSVYAQLMDFQAAGGGDHPEAVHQALHEAVQRIGWSRQGQAYRTVFLVGDAPPQRYAGEPELAQIVEQAAARGIVINTIQAGSDDMTRSSWRQIAQLAGGAYFEVGQSGSAVAVATPFDVPIAELARELDDTRLFYGDEETRDAMAAKSAAADKLHAVASPSAQAKRASFNASEAGRTNLLGKSELVDAVASGRVKLEDVAEEQLPPALAAMAPAARAETIEKTAQRRREISAEIERLASQRQAHIATELADSDRRDSLDHQLFETVKAQAAAKGLGYEAGATPKH